jgi:acetyl-CoA decarbonylase/synthase complex subunit gamma
MKKVAVKTKMYRPLLYAAGPSNAEEMGAVAVETGLPIAVKGGSIEEVEELTKKLAGMGIKDIVLDTGARELKAAFTDAVGLRRAALTAQNRDLGFPTIVFPCEMSANYLEEALMASTFIAKYGGIIVLSAFRAEAVFPLLLQRLNIYTDPQRPMTVTEGIYEINNPGPDSPVLVTTNFSLTYFIVAGEIEASRVPSWLLIKDSEGLSVLTAWAAGKFAGDDVGLFIKKSGIEEKISHKTVVIPGYAASISGEMEEELPGWNVQIGPREAAHIPKYLKDWSA